MLKETFTQLSLRYTTDKQIIEDYWKEIEESYSSPERYYHTLSHLKQMFISLSEVNELIGDWDTLLFSLFYHDSIYYPSSSGNEEKSAELAGQRLVFLNFTEERILKCQSQIIATKMHNPSDDSDTNFFTDADLSILGQEWIAYSEYSEKIRKEYSVFPDMIYVPGRINVLEHFIQMERIFKTDHFYKKYEEQARENIRKEIELLHQ